MAQLYLLWTLLLINETPYCLSQIVRTFLLAESHRKHESDGG